MAIENRFTPLMQRTWSAFSQGLPISERERHSVTTRGAKKYSGGRWTTPRREG